MLSSRESSVVKFLNSCKDRKRHADLSSQLLPLLKRIATAVVLIPIVLALILRAPVPVLAVVAAVVALLTILEFLKLTESYGVQPLRLPTYHLHGTFLSGAGDQRERRDATAFDRKIPGCCLAFAAAIAPFLFLTHRHATG